MESEALGTLIINKLHAGIKVGWFCQVSVFGNISVVLIGTVFRSAPSKLLVLEKTGRQTYRTLLSLLEER